VSGEYLLSVGRRCTAQCDVDIANNKFGRLAPEPSEARRVNARSAARRLWPKSAPPPGKNEPVERAGSSGAAGATPAPRRGGRPYQRNRAKYRPTRSGAVRRANTLRPTQVPCQAVHYDQDFGKRSVSFGRGLPADAYDFSRRDAT